MIEYSDGTVFNAGAQTLVNTVNCAGAMGTGIALEFRLRYPAMFAEYAAHCRRGQVRAGQSYLYRGGEEPWVLNFPTKDQWRNPSRLEWVEAGLKRFAEAYREWGITSAAFPPLGCSNGGLKWEAVRPLMERYLAPLELKATVCLDRDPEASGIEGRMVGIVNDTAHPEWMEGWNEREAAVEAVRAALPLRRMRDLLAVLDTRSYAGLFRCVYARARRDAAPDAPAMTVGQTSAQAAGTEKDAVQLTFLF